MSDTVRPAIPADADAWTALRHALWPDEDRALLAADVADYFAGRSRDIVLAFLAVENGAPAGFLELNLRSVAEGCEHSPVPHVEGWYVAPAARHRGVGQSLLRAAESWARAQGFTELTSDTTDDYPLSLAAHERAGFRIVERLIAFHKRLPPG